MRDLRLCRIGKAFRHIRMNVISKNVDIATVSHRLGHEKITTTLSIYTHFIPNKDFAAADLLDDIWDESNRKRQKMKENENLYPINPNFDQKSGIK